VNWLASISRQALGVTPDSVLYEDRHPGKR
jgi:hypothetical protein